MDKPYAHKVLAKSDMSKILLEYPHSLSYQETIFTKLSGIMMHAVLSTMLDLLSVTKSWLTTASEVKPNTPLRSDSLRLFSSAKISSSEALLFRVTVKSTTETLAVGTLNAIPVSLPFKAGITLPTALAAPVLEGIMLFSEQRPPLQSLALTASTVF